MTAVLEGFAPSVPKEDEVIETTRLLAVLSNPVRFRILAVIHEGPGSTVGQIADDLDLDPNKVTYLVRCLRDEGIVERTPIGKWAHYKISDSSVKSMMETLLAEWDDGAAGARGRALPMHVRMSA